MFCLCVLTNESWDNTVVTYEYIPQRTLAELPWNGEVNAECLKCSQTRYWTRRHSTEQLVATRSAAAASNGASADMNSSYISKVQNELSFTRLRHLTHHVSLTVTLKGRSSTYDVWSMRSSSGKGLGWTPQWPTAFEGIPMTRGDSENLDTSWQDDWQATWESDWQVPGRGRGGDVYRSVQELHPLARGKTWSSRSASNCVVLEGSQAGSGSTWYFSYLQELLSPWLGCLRHRKCQENSVWKVKCFCVDDEVLEKTAIHNRTIENVYFQEVYIFIY